MDVDFDIQWGCLIILQVVLNSYDEIDAIYMIFFYLLGNFLLLHLWRIQFQLILNMFGQFVSK